nr:hypothetical protein [Tanacetum cinerariifolium]
MKLTYKAMFARQYNHKLDGEVGFVDVAGSGVDCSGLSHDESFGVDDFDLNLNEHEFSVEDVVIEDYVSSEEDGEDAELGTDDDDDDVDEYFLVDEENEIVEPDVDVHLFGISMDIPFDNISITNLVPDDVLEGEDVDVINADGFDSDPGNDEEINYKKRRLAELRTEMEGVINASGQWKIRARCEGKVPVFTMSQGTEPTSIYSGMEAGPNGSSGPTTRSKKGRIQNWVVKTHKDTHTCLQSREIKHGTYKFLSEKIFEQVRVNLDIPVKAVQDQLQRELKVQISVSKAFRAKAKAKREIRGDHVLQYSMLRDYVVELQSIDPNTIVKIAVERNTDPSFPTKATKDETPEILKSFIVGIENKMNHKEEFSVARAPQQNDVAKRKNRTLIEAARTMLADSKLLTTFWAEAVNTPCYVQNRVLVIKPHNKTPYELFLDDEVADDAGKKSTEVPRKENKVQDPAKEDLILLVHQLMLLVLLLLLLIQEEKEHKGISWKDTADTGMFSDAYDDEVEGANADFNNLELTTKVWRLVDLPKGKHAIITKWVYRNKKDERGIVVRNKARLVAQEEEVYVCQPLGFEDPHFLNKVYKVEKALYGLHEALRAWSETLSTYLLENEFRRGIIDKNLFIKKDKGDILSMIGSLMYLTTSRPDIMFVVCACARFQVTPKISHLYAVKRIFGYLKRQPKLGLWYPRKQTVVANSTTEAEYVAATNCCRHAIWIQNQMLDYGFNFMNTKIYIDNESIICIVKNPVYHLKTKHIEIRHHFIKDSYEKRLIQVIKIHTDHNVADLLIKAFDVSSFNFLIASIGLLNLRGMVQAPREVGECLEVPTNTHHTYIITQPSSSQPQKKQKSRRKQRKETEVPHTEPQTKESVPTISNDPLPSGEDRMQLTELMNLCTNLQKQAGSTTRVESFEDKESLGDQEDASKQERMIDGIDQDVKITLVDKAQERMNKEDMFGVNDLDGDETLIEIKAAKPKARGVIVQEPSEFRTTLSSKPSQLLQAKEKEIVEERSKKTQAEVTEGSFKRAGDELKTSIEKTWKFYEVIKERFKKTKPVDDMDNLLFQTLKTMFEHPTEDNIWRYQQGIVKVMNWKLFDLCGVHCVTTQNMVYYLLVEKMCPFTKNILHQM